MKTINKLALAAAILLTASSSAFAQSSKIHIDTSVEDFNYETLSGTLKIQSFVENDILNPNGFVKPIDIVLVLDLSSSMKNNTANVTTYQPVSSGTGDNITFSVAYTYSNYGNNKYYYEYNGSYYQVKRGGGSSGGYYLYFEENGKTHYLSGTGLSDTKPTNVTSNTKTIWTGTLYQKVTESSFIQILKSATRDFVDAIALESSSTVDNRIAIATYATNADNVFKGFKYIYGNEVEIKNKISSLTTSSNTYTGRGMQMAETIISGLSDTDLADRDQVVILFTDGDAETGQANVAIEAGYNMKHDKGVTIYSVALTGASNPLSTAGKNMMKYISSNYPDAESTSDHGKEVSTEYYMESSTGSDLDDIFVSIAEKLKRILIGKETQMQGGTFQSSISLNLPAGTSTIDAKTVALTGYSNGNFTFSTTEKNVTGITFDKETLTATGFDYSDNWCGRDDSNKLHGNALILRVPFTFTPTSVNQELELYESGKTPGLYDKESNKYVLAAAPAGPQFVELIIEKKGLSSGESAIFDLDRVKTGSETTDVHVNRIVLTGTSSGGSVSYTVPFLNPAATYYVTEHTDWSWTYKATGTPEANGFIKLTKDMSTVPSGETAKLTFENTKYSADKLSSNAETISK